jgi:uncharacterized protein YqeY
VGRVGGAQSELIEARDLVDFGIRWMDEHLAPLAPAATEVRARLMRDLVAARKARDGSAVSAIGSLLTALANAEAVPVADGPYEVVAGSGDVPRRQLAASDIATVIEAEVTERQDGVERFRQLGVDPTALEAELAVPRRYRSLK